jgi:hypothetical protein
MDLIESTGMGELRPFPRTPSDPGEPTKPCSRCGHPVDTAAIRCRRCGQSTLPPRHVRSGYPWWMVLGIILAVVVVLGLLLGP